MPENQTPTSIQLAEGFDPFSDAVPQVQTAQVDEPPTQVQTAEPQVTPEPAQTQAEPQTQPEPVVAPTFDPNQFIRERFGFESVEEAEQEFKKVKEFKEPTFDFQDETSKSLFNAIKENKIDDIYEILNQQKKLEKLTTAELNPDIAAEIIKTNISTKYKDLSPDEVDLLFYDTYFVPSKPEQGFDESDEDYNSKVASWQAQVDYVNRKMIIDAKVQRPELAKLKSELKLPDINNEAAKAAESQEEFEMMQQARSIYERTLDSEFKNFNGFNVSVKDEDVEIPITFNVGEDERLAMRNELSDFDSDSYFGERWFNEEGKPNVQQIMADKYLLENYNKILQKVANEAASQRLLAHLKKTGNINLNQPIPQGTPKQDPKSEQDRLAEWAFSM